MRKAFIQLHFAVLLAVLPAYWERLITLNEGLLVWYRLLIMRSHFGFFFLHKETSKISIKECMKILE
jgi:hypothetical protein